MKKNKTEKIVYPEVKNIKKVIQEQQKYWNNGDIDGFMQSYWNSEELIFTSLNHQPTYGRQSILESYKKSYPTQASIAELKFEFLYVSVDSDNISANLKGCWELVRNEGNPIGKFFLELKKMNGNWKITKDSTISY